MPRPRDAAELLHIEMDQLDRTFAFITGRGGAGGPDHLSGPPIAARQVRDLVAPQGPGNGPFLAPVAAAIRAGPDLRSCRLCTTFSSTSAMVLDALWWDSLKRSCNPAARLAAVRRRRRAAGTALQIVPAPYKENLVS